MKIGEVWTLPDGAISSADIANQFVFEGQQTNYPIIFPPDTPLCWGAWIRKMLPYSDSINQLTKVAVQNNVYTFFYREVFWDTIGAGVPALEAEEQEIEQKENLHCELNRMNHYTSETTCWLVK